MSKSKKKLKPFALEKPGQRLADKSCPSYENTSNNSQARKSVQRQREEVRTMRRAQNKQARQFLKNELKDEVERLNSEFEFTFYDSFDGGSNEETDPESGSE